MINYLPNKYNFGNEELPRVTINGRRHYMVDGLPLPSVTTVLGFKPKEQLIKWREKIGEEEAAKISHQATFRGDQIHAMAENYITTGDPQYNKYLPINIDLFQMVKAKLDTHLTEAYGCEVRLYSKTLGCAGATDLLGQWDGIDSVIDFKGSTKSKREDWIHDYFKQESLYSFMAFERSAALGTPFFPKQLVTLVATEATKTCDVFIQRAAPWLDEAMKTIQEYQEFIINGG